MSYIDKALSQSETPRRKLKGTTGSQADFIQALRILGTIFSSRTSQLDPWQPTELGIQAVFLNCSLDTWEWVFGAPRNIVHHAYSAVKRCVQTWECLCEDGVVMCVGHLVQHASGGERVVLTRILLVSGSSPPFSACSEPPRFFSLRRLAR